MPRKPDDPQAQSRTWTFTDFKVERLDIFWRSIAVKHLWIGLETGSENGTKHLQGVVVWLRPYRRSQLMKLCPGAHFERAAMIDAENYVMKEDLVLERHLSDVDELKRRAERQWTSKDFRVAVCQDISDGVCNRCLFKQYAGYMFQNAPKVFAWRWYIRYGTQPPWRREDWCQSCGTSTPPRPFPDPNFPDRQPPHECVVCSRCSIKDAPPTPALDS